MSQTQHAPGPLDRLEVKEVLEGMHVSLCNNGLTPDVATFLIDLLKRVKRLELANEDGD